MTLVLVVGIGDGYGVGGDIGVETGASVLIGVCCGRA